MNPQKEIYDVNQGFYDAFNKQDKAAMEALWGQDDKAVCIHPGWPVIRGHERILQSWRDIFEHTDHMEIKLSDIDVLIEGDLAWVSCQENLFSINPEGVQQSAVHATNLYQRIGGDWKMMLHHAGPIPNPREHQNN